MMTSEPYSYTFPVEEANQTVSIYFRRKKIKESEARAKQHFFFSNNNEKLDTVLILAYFKHN